MSRPLKGRFSALPDWRIEELREALHKCGIVEGDPMWGLFDVFQSSLKTQYSLLRVFSWIAARLSRDVRHSAKNIEEVSKEFTDVIGKVKIFEDEWPKLCDEFQSSFSKALQTHRRETEQHDRVKFSDFSDQLLQRFEVIEKLLKNSRDAAISNQAALVKMILSTSAETKNNLTGLSTTIAEKPKKTSRTLQAVAGISLMLLCSAGTYVYDHKGFGELALLNSHSDEDLRSLSDADKAALKSILQFNNPRELIDKCNASYQRLGGPQQLTCSVDLNLK